MIPTRQDWSALRGRLETLFLASFGRPVASGYLDWRYINNDQEKILFSIEVLDGLLVASYSAFPVRLTSNGKLHEASMSMTTMTHPDYQGRGFFRKLATELYLEAEALQIAAVFGFPNASSHPIFNEKLGWSDIYEIPTMVFHLKEADIFKLSLSSEVRRDDKFLFGYPDPPADGLIRVHRTSDYLSWRYAKNPINTYRNYVLSSNGNVSSYIITKWYGVGVDLVDIQTLNPNEASILLRHIAKESFDQGARCLSCWAPVHHYIHGVLERIGFENQVPVTYFGGRELTPSSMPLQWLNYKNWYIQMGDSDVY